MNLPDQFLNWRMIDGKKVPCRPDGAVCDAHDPANHVSRAVAEAAPYDVAFALTENDDWFFLDLDKCYTADGGWTSESQALFMSFAGAWGEVSTSGTGLHIMGRCDASKLQDRRNKWDGWKEFYTQGRFIAFGKTGWAPIGGVTIDRDWTDMLLKVVPQREFLGDLPDGRDPTYTGPENDDELISMALNSRSVAGSFGGVTFKDLWTANADALGVKYPAYEDGGDFDHSSADAALMSHLAFWTGKDMPRMDRLFRRSALMRDKYEKRDDYRADTIQKSARLCGKVYDKPRPVLGEGELSIYLSIDEMKRHFTGCVYIRDAHRVLTPDGEMLRPEQFNAAWGGHQFAMMPDGTKSTRKAFEALTESSVVKFPQAASTSFHPDKPFQTLLPDGTVNTFIPPDIKMRAGDIEPFLDYMRRLLPNDDDRSIALTWAAAIVQNPGKKALWALVFQGAEGNGKSTFSECLKYAIGPQYCHRARAKELGTSFNGWQVGKILIEIPEVDMMGKREMLDDLKPNITELVLPIRPMYQPERNMHVPANWLFMTNHKNAVIKSKSDRRYAMLFTPQQSDADVQRDFPGRFFPHLWDWLRDEGGFEIVAHFLHNMPLDERFNPFGDCVRAPRTSSTEEAIATSIGGIEAEIIEAVESDMVGFRGGWISTWALDKMMRSKNLRVSRPRMGEILRELGYEQAMRAPRPIVREELQRPMLWSRTLGVTFEDYLAAQMIGYH